MDQRKDPEVEPVQKKEPISEDERFFSNLFLLHSVVVIDNVVVPSDVAVAVATVADTVANPRAFVLFCKIHMCG